MLYKRIVSLSCDIDIDVHDGGGQAQHDDAEGHHVVPQDNLCVVKDRPGPEQREWRLSSCEIIHKPNFDCSLVTVKFTECRNRNNSVCCTQLQL